MKWRKRIRVGGYTLNTVVKESIKTFWKKEVGHMDVWGKERTQ